uniref:Pectin lyase-like superfamily protein n=1 Tax=Zea mays TaxID=4577 RepID=A0A804NQ80_MAIZE
MEARPRLLLVAAVAVFVSVSAAAGAAVVINVKNYGAHGNGVNDDTKPLMAAWKAACGSAGAVTMVVAPGTYYIGPVQFHGPCKASTLTFQLQGTLKAATDLKRFGNDWIEFGWVNGLTVAGGVIDGQGAASWPFNKCPIRKDCKVLPTPEHGGARRDVGEPQVLPHGAAVGEERPDERAEDPSAAQQPQHGRHPHRAQQRGVHRGHAHRHGRRLHLRRPGKRQRGGLPRAVRPGPRHERRQPGPILRRGRRHAGARPRHDLHGHHQRRPHQDLGELAVQEQRRAHGLREHGHEGRPEPYHHRPEVLPLLQLRAQVRVRGHSQGHSLQEHQGHGDYAGGGVASLRRAVPGSGAAGRGP